MNNPAQALSSIGRVRGAGAPAVSPAERKKVRQATIELEAIFLKEMLKASESRTSRGMFGGGMGEEFFQDAMADERARALAVSGGVGMARLMEQEILGETRVKNPVPDADKVNMRIRERDSARGYW